MDKVKLYKWLGERIDEKDLLQDEPMSRHTSFRLGGPADLMVHPRSAEELSWAIDVCRNESLSFLVIGNGTNLLVRDKGIRELVIKISHNLSAKSVSGTTLRAFSGASLSSVANLAWRSGLGGLEFASGIPGTLGGGISMNAGAYGSEMRDVVKTVTVLDSSTGELMEFENGALAFGYRTSRIQVQKDIIIVEAELELSSGEPREILKKMRELNRLRLLKQPLDFPNAGSTFKRPPGNYAGKLIEEAGLKGVRVGGAQVSRKHAGFLINLGYASAEDVLALISLIQREVEDKFGVSLEPEIKIVGEK